MQKYIHQLINDIEDVIKTKRHNPSFEKELINIESSPLIKPNNLNQKPEVALQFNEPLEDYWLINSRNNMYCYFGFSFEQFPPVSILNNKQISALVNAILKMWDTYNFSVKIPDEITSEELYPILCEHMEKTVAY